MTTPLKLEIFLTGVLIPVIRAFWLRLFLTMRSTALRPVNINSVAHLATMLALVATDADLQTTCGAS